MKQNKESKKMEKTTEEKPKRGRPKKSAYVKKLEKDVQDIYGLIAGFGQQLKEINETLTGEKQPEVKIETKTDSEPAKKDETKNDYPVPEDYRKAVDRTLNQEFGIYIEPCKDSPEFNFVIVVPDKYSSFGPEELKMKKSDLRSKNITYAEKTNGVKLWAEKVYNSFNPEVKAQIVSDRKLT